MPIVVLLLSDATYYLHYNLKCDIMISTIVKSDK